MTHSTEFRTIQSADPRPRLFSIDSLRYAAVKRLIISLVVGISLLNGNWGAAEAYGQDTKSLVIGIDGLGYGTQGMSVASTPWMDSLIDGVWQEDYRGAYSDSAFAGGVLGTSTEQITVSGPGWTTIMCGVWIDRHGVSGNGSNFANGNFADNPPYQATLKFNDANLKTATFVNWEPIDDNIMASVDNDSDPSNDFDFRGTYTSDDLVAQDAATALANPANGYDSFFVSLDDVDIAGHSHGSSGLGYRLEIESTDELVGDLLNAIASRSTFDSEDWQIVITSDHGHRPGGHHGGQTALERTIPFIVASKSLTQGRLPGGVSHADVAPTVIAHFDMAQPARYWGKSRASGGVTYFDDFEGLELKPFTVVPSSGEPIPGYVPPENIPEWVVVNDFKNGFECLEEAYNGWRVLDRDQWICEQNGQNRNQSGALGDPNQRNSILVADPDAADDFANGTGADNTNYNSRIHHDYDLTGADLDSLVLSLDYEFRCEDSQRKVIEVSFDGGTTYQTLLNVKQGQGCSGGQIRSGPASFFAGTDFSPPEGATSMRLRIGCLEAGNDWWFAVDNISLDDQNGNIAFEDFEGREMELFTIAGLCLQDIVIDDGTDYTGDVAGEIPGWEIDNSQMLAVCLEEGYNGWRAIDVDRWVEEQGAQLGRSKFASRGVNNTVLLADPDAFHDFVEGSAPADAFNSIATRTYDLSGLDPTTLEIGIDWEFATFSSQRGVIEVRFGEGGDWQTLLNLDSITLSSDILLDDQSSGTDSDGRTLKGVWRNVDGDFVASGNEVTLRISCLTGGNDWWFAVDNISVSASPVTFVLGDANDDGALNNLDILPIVLAFTNLPAYELMYPQIDVHERLDMNGDGIFSNEDLGGFMEAFYGT